MQLSRAADQAEPTGALLRPVEAVASAEPAKKLVRDDEQSSAQRNRPLSQSRATRTRGP
jgi:hypothetical protein